MIAPTVNGYLVVSPKEPGAIYQGPDRSPWDQIDECFYEGTLPEHIRAAYEFLKSDPSSGLWWPTCTDLRTAKVLAEYSGKAGRGAEVLAIHSPYLACSRDREGRQEPRARLLGVDVIAVGEWSLLRALLEATDPKCRKAVGAVNAMGLLPDAAGAMLIEARYRELAAANSVEAVADAKSGTPLDVVTVYGLEEELSDE